MESVLGTSPGIEQVRAAVRLWCHSTDLVRAERSLFALQGYFPRNDGDSVLLKLVALQTLDGGRAFGAERWAAQCERLLAGVDARSVDLDLVDRLGLAAQRSAREHKGALTFASRFAHYFLDVDRFPVLDAWSESELERLAPRDESAPSRYAEFAARHARVAAELGVARPRQLWCCLWLVGQYRAWRRNPRRSIHRAARALFESCPAEAALLLPSAPRVTELAHAA
jgi:hypothetical protein